MDVKRLWGAVAVFALLSGDGCDCEPALGPNTFAERDAALYFTEAVCNPFFGCACDPSTSLFADDSACRVAFMPTAESWVSRARELGLTWDQACADQLFGPLPDGDGYCGMANNGYWLSCNEECQIYFGSAGLDEPCEVVGRRVSTCSQGLACGTSGRCVSPCDASGVAQESDSCGYDLGHTVDCGPGLACIAGTCIIGATENEPCSDSAPCEDALWCESGTCAQRGGEGAACSESAACLSRACVEQVCTASQGRVCEVLSW